MQAYFLKDFIDIDLQLSHIIKLHITHKKEQPFQVLQNMHFIFNCLYTRELYCYYMTRITLLIPFKHIFIITTLCFKKSSLKYFVIPFSLENKGKLTGIGCKWEKVKEDHDRFQKYQKMADEVNTQGVALNAKEKELKALKIQKICNFRYK